MTEFSVLKTTGDIAAVRILDISAVGFCVSSPSPMPLNTRVEVRFGGARIPGYVKNCRCISDTEFHLGILSAAALDNLPTRIDHLPTLRRIKMANRGIPIDRREGL